MDSQLNTEGNQQDRYQLQTSAKFTVWHVYTEIEFEAWSNKGQPLTIKLTLVFHGMGFVEGLLVMSMLNG